MLKEKTINLIKPVVNNNYVKIAKNENYPIEKINEDVINKIIEKRNSFNKLYKLDLITEDDLVAFISTINAIVIDAEGIMWADFNVIIYSK